MNSEQRSLTELLGWVFALLLLCEALGAFPMVQAFSASGSSPPRTLSSTEWTIRATESGLALCTLVALLHRVRWASWVFAAWWVAMVTRIVTFWLHLGFDWAKILFGMGGDPRALLSGFQSGASFVSSNLALLNSRGVLQQAPLLVALLLGGWRLLRDRVPMAVPRPMTRPLARRLPAMAAAAASTLVIVGTGFIATRVSNPVLLVLFASSAVLPVVVLRRVEAQDSLPAHRLVWLLGTVSFGWLFGGGVLLGPPVMFVPLLGWILFTLVVALAYVIELEQVTAAWKARNGRRGIAAALSSLVAITLLWICFIYGLA